MEYNKTHNITPKSVSNYQETTEKANFADPVVPYTRSTDLSKLIKETALTYRCTSVATLAEIMAAVAPDPKRIHVHALSRFFPPCACSVHTYSALQNDVRRTYGYWGRFSIIPTRAWADSRRVAAATAAYGKPQLRPNHFICFLLCTNLFNDFFCIASLFRAVPTQRRIW